MYVVSLTDTLMGITWMFSLKQPLENKTNFKNKQTNKNQKAKPPQYNSQFMPLVTVMTDMKAKL